MKAVSELVLQKTSFPHKTVGAVRGLSAVCARTLCGLDSDRTRGFKLRREI